MTKNPSCADEKTPMSLTRQGNVFQIPYSTFVMSLWLCFPLQNTVTRLSFPSSSLFPFFSLLCPLLLDLHAAFVLSGCENLPLPIMERQREGRGRVLPAAQPAKQAGSLSVFPWKAATHLFPRLPAVNTEHGEVCQCRKTMQPMVTQT